MTTVVKRLACLVVLCSACSPTLQLDDRANIACTSDADCPLEQTCLDARRCVSATTLDHSGPTVLEPPHDSIQPADTAVAFSWSEVPNAGSYQVDIALTADFSTLVGGAPQVSRTNVLSLVLPVGTYWWRVRSDVTADDVVLAVGRFGVLADTVFVRCEGTDDCVPGPVELGTPQLPFRSINTGILNALADGRPIVRVASRDDANTPYHETIRLEPGITVSGGYDATFVTTLGRTNVTNEGVVLIAAGVATPTRVEHFALSSSNQVPAASSTVILLTENTHDLVLHDLSAHAPFLVDDIVHLQGVDMTQGPILDGCELSGTYDTARSDTVEGLTIVRALAAAVELDNTTLTGAFAGENSASLLRSDGDVVLAGSQLTTGGSIHGTQVYGIFLESSANLSVSHSQLSMTHPNVPTATGVYGNAESFNADTSSFAITGPITGVGVSVTTHARLALERSTIDVRAQGAAYGVSCVVETAGRLDANVITAAGVTFAYGVYLTQGVVPIVNNTIVLDGAANQYGIDVTQASAAIVNNVFVSSTPSCTGTCRIATTASDAADEYVTAFANNAAIGFDSDMHGCVYAYGAEGAWSCIAVTGPLTSDPHPYVAANQSFATVSDAALTADYRMTTAASPLWHAGHDTATNDCIQGGSNVQPRVITAPSCGGVTMDHDGVSYNTPPSIGAFELEQ